MSLLFVTIEDAERALGTYRKSGTCDPDLLTPMIEWLRPRIEDTDRLRAACFEDAICDCELGLQKTQATYAARMLLEVLEQAAGLRQVSQESMDYATVVLARWCDIQCAHA